MGKREFLKSWIKFKSGAVVTYSWCYDGLAGTSFVTFELFPNGATTTLKLTHTGVEKHLLGMAANLQNQVSPKAGIT